ARSPGDTSPSALEQFPRHAASGCLRRIRAGLRERAHSRSGLLGTRAPEVLRSGGGAQISGRSTSFGAHRGTVCHRERDPWTGTRETSRGPTRAHSAVAGIPETVVRRNAG